MSYANEPVTPAKVRPSTVSVSSYLLYLVVLVEVVSVVATLATMGTMSKVYEDAYAGTEMEDAGGVIGTVSVLVGAVLGILFAVGLVILAIFNNRGKNGSRITTWVVGAILLCCSGFGLIGTAAGNAFSMDTGNSDVPSAADIQDRINDELPWLMPVQILTYVVVLLALLVALILLALPPSNEFFRKPQPEWQPPAGGQGGYLAYPAYPAPGAPPAGPGPAAAGPSAPPSAGPAPSAPDAPAPPPAGPPAGPPAAPPAGPEERPGGGS